MRAERMREVRMALARYTDIWTVLPRLSKTKKGIEYLSCGKCLLGQRTICCESCASHPQVAFEINYLSKATLFLQTQHTHRICIFFCKDQNFGIMSVALTTCKLMRASSNNCPCHEPTVRLACPFVLSHASVTKRAS